MKRILLAYIMLALALVGEYSCSNEGASRQRASTNQAPACMANDEIDPQIYMHLLDFGNKIAKALFERDPIPVLASLGISEEQKQRANAVANLVATLVPEGLQFDSGKLVFALWLPNPDGIRNDIPCRMGNGKGVWVHPDLSKTAGNPTGILAYRFGTKQNAYLLVLEMYHSQGYLHLARMALQQVAESGKDAAYFTAAAEQAESKADAAIAALMYQTAAKLLPNDEILQSFASKRLMQKAAAIGKGKLPSIDAPITYTCNDKQTKVVSWSIADFHGKSILKVTFLDENLEEEHVRNVANCMASQMQSKHRALSFFAAILFEARNSNPGEPGEFLRVVVEL